MIYTGVDMYVRILDGIGNYLPLHFRNLDLSGPLAPPTHEQNLVLDSGKVTEFSHYLRGNDMQVMDAVGLSFSASLETVTGINPETQKLVLVEALTCRDARNPVLPGWTTYGASTKGTTKRAGKTTPKFYLPGDKTFEVTVDSVVDTHTVKVIGLTETLAGYASDMMIHNTTSGTWTMATHSEDDLIILEDVAAAGDVLVGYDNKRTVDIELAMMNPGGHHYVLKYSEVLFPEDEITFSEAEDGITISCSGGCFGSISRRITT